MPQHDPKKPSKRDPAPKGTPADDAQDTCDPKQGGGKSGGKPKPNCPEGYEDRQPGEQPGQ